MSGDDRRAEVAAAAARAGGAAAFEDFRTELAVETKANKNDLVTAADHSAQAAVRDRIHEAFPSEPVVAEEGDAPAALPETGPAWVVDPIDGTANFVRGMRVWTTSVAAVIDGAPVGAASALPALDDVYTATSAGASRSGEPMAVSTRGDPETFAVAVLGWGPTRDREAYVALSRAVIERFGDLRRVGSMQAALAFVASGELDAAVTTERPAPWDAVAGAHLVERAGGTVTDGQGEPWHHDAGLLVASNGQAHEALLDVAPTG
ncbi:MAG: inositol monophosphatase [Halobacteriales archaeon]